MTLSNYLPIADALVDLLHPLAEIVVHEIESDRIVYIKGSLSGRKIGDSSLLDKEALQDVDKIIYPKINVDGRLVKSISVRIEERWLLCLNVDISLFSKIHALSAIIVQNRGVEQPKLLFANDWQEKLHRSVHHYLQNHNLSFEHLSNAHKKDLVKHLFCLGAFNEKNAADYVAKILNLGRATVFKYLKGLKKE